MEYYIKTSFVDGHPNLYNMERQMQSHCKYILNIDGFVTAWRLPFDLSYGSVVLIIENININYKSLFDDLLIDGVNCIKLSKDVSNLNTRMGYLLTYDADAQVIGENGKQLSVLLTNIDVIAFLVGSKNKIMYDNDMYTRGFLMINDYLAKLQIPINGDILVPIAVKTAITLHNTTQLQPRTYNTVNY